MNDCEGCRPVLDSRLYNRCLGTVIDNCPCQNCLVKVMCLCICIDLREYLEKARVKVNTNTFKLSRRF